MVKMTIELLNEEGMHARPAGVLAKTLSTFKSQIDIEVQGNKKNAKSIMSLMSMGLKKGSLCTFHINGEDEELASTKIKELFIHQFKLT